MNKVLKYASINRMMKEYVAYDGEGDDKEKKFSQEDLNRFLAEEKRKDKKKNDELIAQLETLKKNSGLSEQEKSDLQARIENLQSEHLTATERAAQEKRKLEEKLATETKKLADEASAWKARFTDSTIMRSITDAAVAAEAYHPSQVVAILRANTRLAEALDGEGKPTGELIPKVKFDDTDKNGKPVTLDMAVTDTVKRMTELPQYANLFKNKQTPGVGGQGSQGGQTGKPGVPPSDPKAYRQFRKDNPLT